MTVALSISSLDSSSHNQQQNCLQIYLTPTRYCFRILYPSHTSCPCVCWAPDPRPFYTVSLPGDISFVHSRYYPYSLLTVLKEKVFHEIKLATILMIFSHLKQRLIIINHTEKFEQERVSLNICAK